MNKIISLIAVVSCAIVALTSCSSTRYIPVETVTHDSIYVNRVSVDTLMQRDSIYVEHKGDTILVEKYKYIYKTKERIDTAYIERTDSVQVPYPVERSMTRWEKAKQDLGGMAFGALILVCVAFMYNLIKKRKSQ